MPKNLPRNTVRLERPPCVSCHQPQAPANNSNHHHHATGKKKVKRLSSTAMIQYPRSQIVCVLGCPADKHAAPEAALLHDQALGHAGETPLVEPWAMPCRSPGPPHLCIFGGNPETDCDSDGKHCEISLLCSSCLCLGSCLKRASLNVPKRLHPPWPILIPSL